MATATDERDHPGGFGVVDPFARVFAAVSTELVASYRMSRRAAGETVARARGFGARTEFTRRACTAGIVSAEQTWSTMPRR